MPVAFGRCGKGARSSRNSGIDSALHGDWPPHFPALFSSLASTPCHGSHIKGWELEKAPQRVCDDGRFPGSHIRSWKAFSEGHNVYTGWGFCYHCRGLGFRDTRSSFRLFWIIKITHTLVYLWKCLPILNNGLRNLFLRTIPIHKLGTFCTSDSWLGSQNSQKREQVGCHPYRVGCASKLRSQYLLGKHEHTEVSGPKLPRGIHPVHVTVTRSANCHLSFTLS